ncbi:3-hydroxyacyl-CoA dehydrogenase [Papillibacter cinnamivorans]|uniref:3-hydroxyacyl-CoA dehydrogenase n=1 Tax=Papillibacter cinnamivorans TaxID=100176 RepID=UPI000A0352AD|nr:3-hydroxyacyl-CoA dehydrogenase NAD-binding domain-containing protein [Papillibacter cinnamivorans]
MKATDIKKVACIGAGVIGYSWATNFCMKGYPTVVYDVFPAALDNAKVKIGEYIDILVNCDVFSKEVGEAAKARVSYTSDLKEAVQDAQFMQESGPENYEIKQKLLAEIDKYAPADAIYSSSTSGLLISEIAKFSEHADRCLGGHPYNPPHLIPLVELAKGDKTTDEVVQTAYDFYKLIGKEPIILRKEVLGFISNRLQNALYREYVEIVSRGVCSIEDADKALVFGPGIRWGILGPTLTWQLGGGAGGIKHIFDHIGPSMDLWLKDMAVWQEYPKDWGAFAQEGVNEEMKNRDKEFGNTPEEIKQFQNKALIELLKIHKKL